MESRRSRSKLGRKYGYRIDIPDIRDLAYRPTVARTEIVIPPSVMLENQLPACWDQGLEGSCCGHGVGGAVAFIHQGFMPSRQQIYFDGRQIEGDTDQDAGAQISDVVQALAHLGVAPEELWPYEESNIFTTPPDEVYQASLPYKISQYLRVADLDDTKQCLAEGFPVIIGFSVYEYFESQVMNEEGILHLPQPNEQLLGGHCVLVTGYNEDTQRVRVRNSWGINWGPFQGNFEMDYAYFQNLVSDCWTIRA